MSSAKVVDALNAATNEYGAPPESIKVDNGTEFTGRALEAWAIAQCAAQLHTAGPAGGEQLH
jgi:hypothetical protein